jgi:hypothetical protein
MFLGTMRRLPGCIERSWVRWEARLEWRCWTGLGNIPGTPGRPCRRGERRWTWVQWRHNETGRRVEWAGGKRRRAVGVILGGCKAAEDLTVKSACHLGAQVSERTVTTRGVNRTCLSR